ncbi:MULTISPECIES: helix-turn-helix domain-containing protein [Paenibacillus]|jgi:two-component system response regulator YesN|uniref:helix-turn-helix domain-containing protein n=1 Tax=Paenibacillus TaxID=44249 RepID=UPI0004902091|nr:MULTISPECIES: helix-turn-helix domain-containing protein [Paenibacillus]MDU0330814.1 helix-turn-helix domain-containing protein [Paenibacillus sp. 3LSP]
MNALVVDDDVYVVAALEKKIEWKALGIDKLYTANNVALARDILQQYPIQILISDIEMPQGSGLELLAWIREENYNVQAIFLTNYADFNYAQKAIELQSFEYFLKPIEFDKLMLILRKAIARAEEQQQREKAMQEGVLWQRNQANLLEYFWRKLVSASLTAPLKPAAVIQAVEDQQLAYLPSDILQPVLIHVFPYSGSLGREEKGLFDFALGNVMSELLHHSQFTAETILEVKEHQWMAILKWNAPPNPSVLAELCSEGIRRANAYLHCDACCLVGLSDQLERIGHALHQLLMMNESLTKTRNRTYWAERDDLKKQPVYHPPNLTRLEELLHQNDSASFLAETARYLRDCLDRKTLDTSSLALFRLDIVQLVYAFLKLKGIEAHKLYAARANEQLLAQSLHSIEDMQEYVTYLVNTAMAYRDFAAEPKSVAEEIKQYIHAHYGDELTRNDLAEVVYLNPDYLARLFKKETGISLGSYIIRVRISVAKQLLETTKLSVYAVANQVGYANYSYFSKLFKQEVGVTPNDYKKNPRSAERWRVAERA